MGSAQITDLISQLGLVPHPEGGHYRRVFGSELLVHPADGRPARPALSAIQFLLAAGEHARWHAVQSAELWHHAMGGPLELLLAPPDVSRLERIVLGPAAEGHTPYHIVPHGCWQAARPLHDFTLVTCAVGPGFDFADHAYLDDPVLQARLRELAPDLAGLL